MSGWRERFEQPSGAPIPVAPDDLHDVELPLDPSEYRPWTLQRGRGRPPLMLELRRYEPRSGLWSGWQLSYPTLIAAEYVGDRLLTLDFGTRQFAIEGRGLDQLARYLQAGMVVLVQEYAEQAWPVTIPSSIITAIRRL